MKDFDLSKLVRKRDESENVSSELNSTMNTKLNSTVSENTDSNVNADINLSNSEVDTGQPEPIQLRRSERLRLKSTSNV